MKDYANLKHDEKPFCDDGMTMDEISRFYRGGADKNEALAILADCNDTTRAEMINLLTQIGLITGTQQSKERKKEESPRMKAAREKVEKAVELADKGLTSAEAAREMGIDPKALRQIASRNGIRFAPADRSKIAKTAHEKKENQEEKDMEKIAEKTGSPNWRDEAERLSEINTRQADEIYGLKRKIEDLNREVDVYRAKLEMVYLIFGDR